MNNRILFLLFSFLACLGINTYAQKGTADDVEVFRHIVADKPLDHDVILQNYFKKNRNNVDNLVSFGSILMENGDTANVRVVTELALKATKNRCAPAYMLLGDIQKVKEDYLEACKYYDMAIIIDPQMPEPYIRYATLYSRISPNYSMDKLEDLRLARPDYPVDKEIAHLYYQRMRYSLAIRYYERLPLNTLMAQDCLEYAYSCYLNDNFEKAADIALKGLETASDNATLNRLLFFSIQESGKAEEAIRVSQRLFGLLSEKGEQPNELDYLQQGKAYMDLKQTEKAISSYKQGLSISQENRQLFTALSEAYVSIEDYPNAIHYFSQALNPSFSTTGDYISFGKLWITYGQTLTGEKRASAFKNAAEAFNRAAEASSSPEESEQAIEMISQMEAVTN